MCSAPGPAAARSRLSLDGSTSVSLNAADTLDCHSRRPQTLQAEQRSCACAHSDASQLKRPHSAHRHYRTDSIFAATAMFTLCPLAVLAEPRTARHTLRSAQWLWCLADYCGGHEPWWCLRQLSIVPDAYLTVSGFALSARENSFASTPGFRTAICAKEASLERL